MISMMAAPTAVLEVAHQVEDLRLDGDVERRGRLVGDQQLGIAGERDGDHHPLAHAARQLVGILVDAPLRLGDADERAASRSRAPRPRARPRPWCSRSVSPICRPTVSTGLRLVIGSWKIMEMSLPRMSRISRVGQLQQVAAVEADASRRSCPAAPGSGAGSTWR